MKGDIYGLRLVKQRERSHFPRISTVRSLPTQSTRCDHRRVTKSLESDCSFDTANTIMRSR
ncbi:MAG TPA: hypothetical protein V6C90_04385 [Coleofasciculaceae cyanobacterium]